MCVRYLFSQIGKGMYVSRKLQFAGMLLRVSGLWAQGDKVRSGAVVDTTRVSELYVSISCIQSVSYYPVSLMSLMYALLDVVCWVRKTNIQFKA